VYPSSLTIKDWKQTIADVDSFTKELSMQVMRTNKGIFYREKVYIDGKAIH
jgi:hypothetical protein